MKNLKGFIHVSSQIKHIKLYWEFSCCRYTHRLIFNAELLQRRIVDYVAYVCGWKGKRHRDCDLLHLNYHIHHHFSQAKIFHHFTGFRTYVHARL